MVARQGSVPRRGLFIEEHLFIRRDDRRALRGSPVACEPAFAAGRLCLLAGPFVRRALFVGRPAALAGNLSLFISVHRRKAAIFGSHMGNPLFDECNRGSRQIRPKCA